MERHRAERHRYADRPRALDPLRLDRQLWPARRQRARQRGHIRGYFRSGASVCGAARKGPGSIRTSLGSGTQRLDHRARCLSRDPRWPSLSRAHADVVWDQSSGLAARRGPGPSRARRARVPCSRGLLRQ